MTRKRTGDPWMPSAQYGRQLTGLSVNLIVRDIAASLPFYTDVLGLRPLYSDPDFAALEGGPSVKIMLHADHTLDHSPSETARLSALGKRGTGAEIRILGIDPDDVEARARARGVTVNVRSQTFPHGWRECRLEDTNGYTFAVGILPEG
jgi:catechol 2,3-dioxygenase-like lactoylglutathione lyase family enzyme